MVFSGKGAMLGEESFCSRFYTQLMAIAKRIFCVVRKGRFYPESLERLKHLGERDPELPSCSKAPRTGSEPKLSLLRTCCGLMLTPSERAGKQGGPGPLCVQGVPWTAWHLLTNSQLSHYQLKLYYPHCCYLPSFLSMAIIIWNLSHSFHLLTHPVLLAIEILNSRCLYKFWEGIFLKVGLVT